MGREAGRCGEGLAPGAASPFQRRATDRALIGVLALVLAGAVGACGGGGGVRADWPPERQVFSGPPSRRAAPSPTPSPAPGDASETTFVTFDPPGRTDRSLPEPVGTAPALWSQSEEYRGNRGLAAIRAAEAYAARPAGRPGGEGQAVAVIDSGVDHTHPDLVVARAGFVADQGSYDIREHGTHVAGIIAARRDGVAMHGVAYRAAIVAIQTLAPDASGFETGPAVDSAAAIGSAAGLNRSYQDGTAGRTVTSNPALDARRDEGGTRIINLSLGTTGGPALVHREAMRDAARRDALIVAALGNDDGAEPSQSPAIYVDDPAIAGLAVAVGNWNPAIASLDDIVAGRHRGDVAGPGSTICGTLRNCLFAPGTDILSTLPGGRYDTRTGTSMAAPHVSGALAVLAAAFPGVPPQQLLQRLYATAVNPLTGRRGEFDTTGRYGWGLMDLGAAMAATGPLTVSAPDGAAQPLAATVAALPRAFGTDALGAALANVVTLDAAGFPFRLALADRVVAGGPQTSALARYAGAGGAGRMETMSTGRIALSAALPETAREPGWHGSSDPGGRAGADDPLVLHIRIAPETTLSLARAAAQPGMAAQGVRRFASIALDDPAVTAPFAAMAGPRDSVGIRHAMGPRGAVSAEAFRTGTDSRGGRSEGVAMGADYALLPVLRLAGTLGITEETAAVWGASGSGALRLGGGVTTHAGASLVLDLHRDVSVFGTASHGTVSPRRTGGLITGAGRFRGEAHALGVEGRNLWLAGDALSLVAAMPFRVSRAPLLLSVPDLDDAGRMTHGTRRVDLAAQGRETRIGLTYAIVPPGGMLRVEIGGLLRLQPDHDRSASEEIALGGRIDLRF